MCNLFKDPSTSGTLVAHTAPQHSHTDKWLFSGNTLTRTHKRSRATLFSPDNTKDRPVGLEDLADERATVFEYEDGSKETSVDNWREVENQKEKSSQRFVGKTVFKLKSAPTGTGRLSKRSTFPGPPPLQEPETKGPTPRAFQEEAFEGSQCQGHSPPSPCAGCSRNFGRAYDCFA